MLSASVFDSSSPNLVLNPFEKTILFQPSLMDDNFILNVHNSDDVDIDESTVSIDNSVTVTPSHSSSSSEMTNGSSSEEITKLKEANLLLYQYALNKIIKK